MPVWDYKVNIQQFLVDDDQEAIEKMPEIAWNIICHMRDMLRYKFTDEREDAWWDLNDLLDELESAGEERDMGAFNDVLSDIYDWADYERVWLSGD